MLLNIRTPHLSNLTSITASPRLSSHMRCVEPPPSATLNHSRSCVVGFFFNRHERFTMQRHLLSRCYHRYMHISIGLKKKKITASLEKRATYTSAQSEICMPVFISFKAPPAQMASCFRPPIQTEGMLLALTSAAANSSVALLEDQHQSPN